MLQPFIARQADTNRFDGYALLMLDSFPSELPPDTAGLLLNICREGRVSCELCLSTATRDGSTAVMLLLRTPPVPSGDFYARLSTCAQLILSELQRRGIRAHYAAANSPEHLPLTRFLGGDLAASARVGYLFPEDRSLLSAYVPGAYGVSGSPLQLSELLSLMNAHPASLLMMQLEWDALTPEDERIARESAAIFQRAPQEKAQAALNVCREKLALAGKPALRLHIVCAGSELFLSAVSLYARGAGLLSCAADPRFLQYADHPASGDRCLRAQMAEIGKRRGVAPAFFRLTHLLAPESLSRAVALPASLRGIRGLRLDDEAARDGLLPALRDPSGLYIGSEGGRPVYLPLQQLSRHGCITGKSGTGKTTFALGFLYRLAEKGLPFIVIEPTKTEYRSLINAERFKNGGLQIFTPGSSAVSPLPLNPFMPPRGVRLEQYKSSLKTVFRMAFSSTPFLSSIIPGIIEECYAQYGWRDSSTSDSPGARPFGMHEFIRVFRSHVRYNILDQESRNNVENSGIMRFQELIANNATLFDTIAAPDYDQMLRTNTIIELDALADEGLKSLVAALLLLNLNLALRKDQNFDGKPRHVLFIDEAHLLLSERAPSAAGSETFADQSGFLSSLLQRMTKEVRAFGMCVFFGDQRPSRLGRDIISGVNMKLTFLHDDREDLSLLADEVHLTGEMQERVKTLPVGEAYFLCDAMETPVRVVTPHTERVLGIAKNVGDAAVKSYMHTLLPAPFDRCRGCAHCDAQMRIDARFLAMRISSGPEVRGMLPDEKRHAALVQLLHQGLPERCRRIAEDQQTGISVTDALVSCVRVHLIRSLLADGACPLTEAQLWAEEPLPPAPEKPSGLNLGGFFKP